MTGASMSIATMIATAPSPSSEPALSGTETAAVATAAMPPARSTPPSAVRTFDEPSLVATSSRIASTGAVSAARRAGTSAATRLTTVPVRSEMAIVKPSIGMSPDISMPMPANTLRSTVTRPRPAPTPSTEPMTPTAAAWPSTDAKTWLGDAPTARSIANSRWRCRTTIWNVLLMMKVPTNRAIAAKISRNVEMKPSIDSHWSRLLSRIWSPVRTVRSWADAFVCRAASTSRMSSLCPTPSSP